MDDTNVVSKATMATIVTRAADHLVMAIERDGEPETLTFIVLGDDPKGTGQGILAALARHARDGQAAKE